MITVERVIFRGPVAGADRPRPGRPGNFVHRLVRAPGLKLRDVETLRRLALIAERQP